MALQITQPAPKFKGTALFGREFTEISLEDYIGKWVCLFFYPLDFTFVCPTELIELNEKIYDFDDRECQVIGASVDSVHSHLGWVKADERLSELRYPLLSDITKDIARSYGILLEEQGIALRGAFLIDPAGNLRFQYITDLSVGRSIEEVLRVLDALQTEQLCPCGWEKGQETLGTA